MKWSRQGWRSGELEGSKGGTPLPISAPDVGTSEHRGVAAGGEAGGQRSRTHGPRQPTAAAAHPTPQGGKAVVEIGGERVLVVKDGGEVGGGGGGGARVGGRGPAHPHLPTPSSPPPTARPNPSPRRSHPPTPPTLASLPRSTPFPTSAPTSACPWWARPPCCRARSLTSALSAPRTAPHLRWPTVGSRASGARPYPTCRCEGWWGGVVGHGLCRHGFGPPPARCSAPAPPLNYAHCCPLLPQIVGKGPKQRPLPTFPVRVTDTGTIEVDK